MTPSLTGGCQCGEIRYQIGGEPHAIYVCHCIECRKQSASAFGISVIVNSSDLELLQGKPSCWNRTADSGRKVDCFFCPRCGSRVWHGDKSKRERISIKGGSLDRPIDLGNATHIWTIRKLPGVTIPRHAQQYAKEPE